MLGIPVHVSTVRLRLCEYRSLLWLISLRVLFRAFQGIGGAGLFSVGLAALVDLVPLSKIPLMSAITGMLSAVAGVLGPIVGGAIGDRTTWRWVFWIK